MNKKFAAELFEEQMAVHTIEGNSDIVGVLAYLADQLKLAMDTSKRIKELIGDFSYADYRAACAVAKNQMRRAQNHGLTEHFTALEWLTLVEECHGCARCRSWFSVTLTVDHIIPMGGGNLGTNTIDNIQPLCDPCHREKERLFQLEGDILDYRRR